MIDNQKRLMIKVVVLMRIAIVFIWFGIARSARGEGRAGETHHTIIESERVDGWIRK